LFLSMLFFGLWWTTSWTTILSCYSSNRGTHPFPCFQTWDGCLPRFHDWHELVFLTHQTCSEASFYTSLFCLIFVSVYVVLWPMMNFNLWGNGICYLCFSCYSSNRERHPCPCFETWDGCLPRFHGWHDLVFLTHQTSGSMLKFKWYCKLFWGLLVLFCPCCHAYDDLVCLMPPIKTCETSMPMFFQYWAGCLSCFHGCHD
jgi:hypothetical protein